LDQRERALELSALAALSGRASSMWNHALRLERSGRVDEAVVWAGRAALRRPQFTGYLRTYAELLLKADRPFEAEMMAHTVLLLSPIPAHELLLAKTLVRQGRHEAAAPHLDRAAAVPSLSDEVQQLRKR